jgi:hypothetical protein
MVEIAIMPSVASITTPAQKPQAPALPLAGQLPVTPGRIHVRRVIKATAEHFGTTVPTLLSRCRERPLTRRRRVAMYVAREMTGRSLSFIGSEMGGRNHSTVLHGVPIEDKRAFAEAYAAAIEALESGTATTQKPRGDAPPNTLGWALDQTPPLLRSNPARDVKSFRYESEGFHTWSADEVVQFEARHVVGTKPRLAFALMYYLGVRKSDAVLLGRQHMRNGEFKFIPKKTRHQKMDPIQLPVPAELAAIIEAGPCGDLTFLVTEYGQPFTSNGFGNWFRDQCHAAGLPQCSAHGLRKARATILAERGATDRQLMAVFGWSSEQQATKYTAAANRKKLARMAMRLPEQKEDTDCPTNLSHQEKA